jgi:hypothetical protein
MKNANLEKAKEDLVVNLKEENSGIYLNLNVKLQNNGKLKEKALSK